MKLKNNSRTYGNHTVDDECKVGFLTLVNEGISVQLTNKTGLNPETQETQGVIVQIDDTTDDAVKIATVSSELPFGVIKNSGVEADAEIDIKVLGNALVLLKDSTACTKGQIAYVSDTAGRAASTAMAATAGYKKIGYFLETLAGGTDVLAKVMLIK